MKRALLFVFIYCSLPTFLIAQRLNETYISVGLNSATYGDDWNEEDDVGRNSVFFEIERTWNKNIEKKISFVKGLSLGLNYFNLSEGGSGLGGGSESEGSYLFTTIGTRGAAQYRISNFSRIQLGASIHGLIIGYENYEYRSWIMHDQNGYSGYLRGGSTRSGINRNYFDQLYYGPDVKLLVKSNLEDNFTIGFNFSFLFTKPTVSNFETKNMLRFAVSIML